MKTRLAPLTRGTILALGLGALSQVALATLQSSASAPGLAPIGNLDVRRTVVRTGTKAHLTWQIEYPPSLLDLARIDPITDTVTPLKDTLMVVRVIGTSYQPSGQDATVQMNLRLGGSAWGQLFLGKTPDLRPSEPVFSGIVRAGTAVDVSGRGQINSYSWTPLRQTGVESANTIALKNGDDVPYYSPAFQQGAIEDHISSYVRDGKIVLNPRDVIYLIELGQNNVTSSGFDMQDLVVVITFNDVPGK